MKHQRRLPRRAAARRGLTLLEVMLALAILGGSLAVIGELMRIGARHAEAARDQTTAQLLCENMMAELVSGVLPLSATTAAPVDDSQYAADWAYTVEIQPIDQQGLVSVRVTVEQNPQSYSRPASFSLTRWMVDPQVAALSMETGGV